MRYLNKPPRYMRRSGTRVRCHPRNTKHNTRNTAIDFCRALHLDLVRPTYICIRRHRRLVGKTDEWKKIPILTPILYGPVKSVDRSSSNIIKFNDVKKICRLLGLELLSPDLCHSASMSLSLTYLQNEKCFTDKECEKKVNENE